MFQKKNLAQTITYFAQNPHKIFRRANRIVQHRWEDFEKKISHALKKSETIVNQKEIRVFGLRRTGNHAIIVWIQKQIQGNAIHLNNIRPDLSPYRYVYEEVQDHYRSHRREQLEFLLQQAQGNFSYKECLIYNYEDFDFSSALNSYYSEKNHDIYLGKSAEKYDLILLRDPFNLLASRIKRGFLDVKIKNKNFIDLWLEYAQEILGETNYLSQNKKIFVNYNQWVQNQNYRQQISEQLGLQFSDAGIDTVPHYGKGSSFDGKEFDGKAKEMDIQNRWKYFLEDKTYRTMLNHPKLWEYSERIFGHIPGTEALKLDS
jgi:hypothetical protein